jgi:hypothetical protein
MTCDPIQEELSPDGRTFVRWAESDGRMSHVIRTPEVLDAASGDTILHLGDSGFDAAIDWAEDGGFAIDLRHYWRPGTLRLTIDRSTGTFRTTGAGAGQAPQPLGALSAFVEAHFKAAGRAAALEAVDLGRSGRARAARPLWATLALGLGVALWVLFLRR